MPIWIFKFHSITVVWCKMYFTVSHWIGSQNIRLELFHVFPSPWEYCIMIYFAMLLGVELDRLLFINGLKGNWVFKWTCQSCKCENVNYLQRYLSPVKDHSIRISICFNVERVGLVQFDALTSLKSKHGFRVQSRFSYTPNIYNNKHAHSSCLCYFKGSEWSFWTSQSKSSPLRLAVFVVARVSRVDSLMYTVNVRQPTAFAHGRHVDMSCIFASVITLICALQ